MGGSTLHNIPLSTGEQEERGRLLLVGRQERLDTLGREIEEAKAEEEQFGLEYEGFRFSCGVPYLMEWKSKVTSSTVLPLTSEILNFGLQFQTGLTGKLAGQWSIFHTHQLQTLEADSGERMFTFSHCHLLVLV